MNIVASVPSPDPSRLLVQASVRGAQGASNLFTPAVGGAVTDSPYVAGSFNASEARFSPDGTRVAYVSDESNRPEVYVRPFPGPGPRVQISQGGGVQPVWAPDGRGLYYVAGSTLMDARLTTGPEPTVISRDSLFSGPYFARAGGGTTYDVSRDGKRFLVVKPSDEQLQLVVTLHWTSELAARLGKN
jgi:Tol biopolymer transport system component